MSRAQIEKKFRQHLGRTPQARNQACPDSEIRQLLTDTDLPLKYVAELAGFDYMEYMCAVFKRRLACPPGHFGRGSASGDRPPASLLRLPCGVGWRARKLAGVIRLMGGRRSRGDSWERRCLRRINPACRASGTATGAGLWVRCAGGPAQLPP